MKNKAAVSAVIGAAVAGAATLLAVPPASALEQGDILARIRLVNVMPNDDSGLVSTAATGPIAGSGVSVDSGPTLDIDFTYMFTDNIGAELLLDLTSKHDVSSKGTLAAIQSGDIIETYVLPPTLLLQYHFLPKNDIRPYVGAGLNYTMFLGEKATAAAKTGTLAMSNVDLDASLGLALQAGVDVDINEDWFLNFDVKYIDVDTEASFNTAFGAGRVDVDIDPWIVGVGIGMRF